MNTIDLVERGRASFDRYAWGDAYTELSAADQDGALASDDLVRLAMAAYLIGKDAESVNILTRAHREALDEGDAPRAALCTFWIGFQLMGRGDMAQAGGWFARGQRVLEEGQRDCVERGYLLIPLALQHLFGGDAATAYPIFEQVADFGSRFGDRDLRTLGEFGRSQSLIAMGRAHEAMAVIDEFMVGVTNGEVSAIVAGLVYCGVIGACQNVFDLSRAHEWTEALTKWCAKQPDLVPYRGQCLVHRAELLQMHGEWHDAMDEATRARDQLLGSPDEPAVGMAFYQLGEIHRLRGAFDRAEEMYRESSGWGHSPHPGLAKLRLAQGQMAAATAAIRREIDEARSVPDRSRLLPAHVEIMIAADDVAAARVSSDELSTMATAIGARLLRTYAAHATGAVLVAEGDVRAALAPLRDACAGWRELEAPYEAARARVLIGLACRMLGDEDTAAIEFGSARDVFERLGAAPDIAYLDELTAPRPRDVGGLTGREVEVLALVATGKSNRDIAADLVLSEKTVARHLSNIFTKLGVSSRAAATAYAYKHDLA